MERKQDTSNSNIHTMLAAIDPKLLHCSTCNRLLLSAIFQCKNRHVACFKCNKVNKNNCSVCSSTLDSCPGVELITESINVSCPHTTLGCREIVPYTQLNAHKESCAYAPCSCPNPNCTFQGSASQLSAHISSQHPAFYTMCGRGHNSFISELCSITQTDTFLALETEGGPLFLLLNLRYDVPPGNLISVVCLGPGAEDRRFRYKILVRRSGRKGCLVLEAPVKNVKVWKGAGYHPTTCSLFVPKDNFMFPLLVNVRIEIG